MGKHWENSNTEMQKDLTPYNRGKIWGGGCYKTSLLHSLKTIWVYFAALPQTNKYSLFNRLTRAHHEFSLATSRLKDNNAVT